VYAETRDDLFFAQGFVQAQDRLFQMDLWRRAVQGRLSEVLGPNFIERDLMTRRIQYSGEVMSDWSSYGADTRAIAASFVRGINAWVAMAASHPPEEFALAGWRPEVWQPEDLLNRTDAFVASADALTEVLRARLVAAVGVRRADLWLPPTSGPTEIPHDLDPAIVSYGVGDAVRLVGTPAFLVGLSGPVGSNSWVVASRRSTTGSPLLANDPHRTLDHPSSRYLVHLHAPGWNVIGATSPWLPGVATGHNDRIAWSTTSLAADVQDLYVEKVNPANAHQVKENDRWVDTRITADSIRVKGDEKPFEFQREYTGHGVIIAVDREHNLGFALRWTGTEAGTAAELAATAIDRADSWEQFRAAAARWKMPAAEMVYADVDGNIGYQTAALIPIRRSWNGALPAPGWVGRFEWAGWRSFNELPHSSNPRAGYVATANTDAARIGRLTDLFSSQKVFALDDFKRWQHDTLAWNAERLVPLLTHLRVERPEVEEARQQLLAWDRRLSVGSRAATLYQLWERTLIRKLANGRLEAPLARDYASFGDVAGGAAPATALTTLPSPTRAWFGPDPVRSRDALLADALASALEDARARSGSGGAILPWGDLHLALFKHPLGVTQAARHRFNVGPFALPGGDSTLMVARGKGTDVNVAASFRQILDLGDWDRSLATNAPGQSGSPASPHFADLATMWARGEYFPLAFSDRAVQAAAETTLVLTPRH
jgi:penicillin amidase